MHVIRQINYVDEKLEIILALHNCYWVNRSLFPWQSASLPAHVITVSEARAAA
jgi:hypothetical protein